MNQFVADHPLAVGAALACLAGVAALAIVLALTSLGGKIFLQAYEAYYRRKSRRRQALWPALAGGEPGSIEIILRWGGWRGVIPSAGAAWGALATFMAVGLAAGGAVGALFAAGAVGLCGGWIYFRAKKNMTAFVAQLPDGLSSLADALHSGFSLPQALDFLSREVRPPLQDVFLALVRAQQLRLPLAAALDGLRFQLGVPEWTAIAETVMAQERLGGNIIPLLEETASALRDRLNVEREIVTLTAAGRMSGLIIGALVPVVLLFFILVNPDYMRLMFTTSLGRLLFLAAMILEIVGFLWIRRVTRVDY